MHQALRQLFRAALFVLSLSITASSGSASDVGEALHAGARVRLFLKPTPEHVTRERIMGLLMGIDEDSVVVNVGPGLPGRAVAIDAVQSFSVARGRKSSAGKGALIGLASGVAGGVIAGQIVCSDGQCEDAEGPGISNMIPAALAVGGGLFGTGMGALIGGRFHSDRWERVSVRDLRMGVTPGSDDVQFRLSLVFP